jgi:hypothetical protein
MVDSLWMVISKVEIKILQINLLNSEVFSLNASSSKVLV